MTGRSSRTMKTHMSKLICVDRSVTNESIKASLEARNIQNLKDGLRLINLIKGRRKAGEANDAEIAEYLKQGWRIDIGKIVSRLKKSRAISYISMGARQD